MTFPSDLEIARSVTPRPIMDVAPRPRPRAGAGGPARQRRGVEAIKDGLNDEALQGVGQDRRLVAPAGGFFATAKADERAETERTSNVSERAHVDHGRTKLGQLALG